VPDCQRFGYNGASKRLGEANDLRASEGYEMWHEDFADEPAVEERMPFGIPPEEMRAVLEEALQDDCCELCGMLFDPGEVAETGMYEYYTMDLDPGTRVCPECLESRRDQFIPDDPSLFDCYTPLACV